MYDVSSYMDEHPGGDDVLLAATGNILATILVNQLRNVLNKILNPNMII